MPRLNAFNNISLDGYFADARGEIGWTQKEPGNGDFDDFVAGNATAGGMLVLGRMTYEMMASFWPTPAAAQMMPTVAERMNAMPKLVFSRSLKQPSWSNTRVVDGDIAGEIRRLKENGEHDMTILGSGTIVTQLADEKLIDEYQFVVNPVALGDGRSYLSGVKSKLDLRLLQCRSFSNGNIYLSYAPRSS